MTRPLDSRPALSPPDAIPPEGGAVTHVEGPPAESVSLADLIDDAGPLPADAALECVQRLAERLTLTPRTSCVSLGPSDVFIDDDGGVWLRAGAENWPQSHGRPQGMDRLGRLLAYLATGDGGHFADGTTPDAAELPVPLSSVARRLFSGNGSCYDSYAELAKEAARLRGLAPTSTEADAGIAAGEPATSSYLAVEPERALNPQRAPRGRAESRFSLGVVAALIGGAVAAYMLWQVL